MQEQSSTETAMLDAAEQLFADQGFDGTRVRAIADASHANLGALHYYWGSKEALFRAVWRRRMEPLIEERRERLSALAAEADTPPDLEELIRIWVDAGLGLTSGDGEPSEVFGRLYGRALTDPSPAVRQVMSEYFDETGEIFLELLRKACPDLDDTELYWRLNALLGAILYVHIGRSRTDHIARGLTHAEKGIKEGSRQLVHVLTVGFRTKSTEDKKH